MAKNLFSYRKHWAHRLGPSPVLPRSREEMSVLGWDACDVILVTGDAYVDHPSFGVALIGRLLEDQGFRVGIIDQPDWHDEDCMTVLGSPLICFGVTAGNMDSMVNRYTADKRVRSDDAYSPDDQPAKRPDRASIVYSNLCRRAFKDIPIILGGIEASLRRAAHFDYWSETVRRSVLLDAKADLLCYGNAERAIIEVVHRLARRIPVGTIHDVAGTAFTISWPQKPDETDDQVLQLPSFEEVSTDKEAFARASRMLYATAYHPESAPQLITQRHGNRGVCMTPPPVPLSTEEMDYVYALPFSRLPHPVYAGRRLSAYEMIRFSVTIMRGCFGGCTFCSIVCHDGATIQSRSEASILKEVEEIRDQVPGFTGVISDLGGPTANMYRMHCKRPSRLAPCERLSCLYPKVCSHLHTDHDPLIALYRKARSLAGVKRVLIGSGVRYDLANKSPAYIKELTEHHVGGYLKIAPEHIADRTLELMQKPSVAVFDAFRAAFERISQEAGKNQYLIPYFIAAHPGSTMEAMVDLALWLKHNGFRPDQVQTFLPSPMTLATTMYHTGLNPLEKDYEEKGFEEVHVPRQLKERRIQKAFLRYHDPENWPILREQLCKMGREDLIGPSKRHLVAAHQPMGSGTRPEGARHPGAARGRKKGPKPR